MSKEKLIQMLSALPNDAMVNAKFTFDRPYSSSYDSVVTGINFVIENDGNLSAVICVKEIAGENV